MARSITPTSPDGWAALAKRELDNIGASYRGRVSNDAIVHHALMAVEFALKAHIWKDKRWREWPKRSKTTSYLYTHDLDAMLKNCERIIQEALRARPERYLSWQVLLNASGKQMRYSDTPVSDVERNEIAKSARHPTEGVVPWLLDRYRQKT